MLPRPNPTVVYRALPDGGVLFSPADESYFGLNVTGACVWENLAPVKGSLEEVYVEIAKRFPDAESERVRRDVSNLLTVLAENGLVVSA